MEILICSPHDMLGQKINLVFATMTCNLIVFNLICNIKHIGLLCLCGDSVYWQQSVSTLVGQSYIEKIKFSLKTTTLYRVLLPPCGNSDKLPNDETSKATLCDAIA